jgi:hypothetical protein
VSPRWGTHFLDAWVVVHTDNPVEAAATAAAMQPDLGPRAHVRVFEADDLQKAHCLYDNDRDGLRLQPARIEGGPRWSPSIVIGRYAFWWDSIPSEVRALLSERELAELAALTAEWRAHLSDQTTRTNAVTLPGRQLR